ncbi:MAG: DUF420 domain-containing protein [Gemmataceae bacterium]
MIGPGDLPAVNAVLNSISALLVVVGFLAIKGRSITMHKICMLSAVVVSAVFLGSYLYYHFAVKGGTPTPFTTQGAPRYAYFTILISHTILAIAAAPLVLITTYFGLRDRLSSHVRLAKWTLPIWLYVSVTGVIVYLMLYQLYG